MDTRGAIFERFEIFIELLSRSDTSFLTLRAISFVSPRRVPSSYLLRESNFFGEKKLERRQKPKLRETFCPGAERGSVNTLIDASK